MTKPRLSDMHGDARRRVLLARHEANTKRWRESQAKKPGLLARIIMGVLG